MSKIMNTCVVAFHNTNKHATPARRRRSQIAVPARYRNRPTLLRTGLYRVWESAYDQNLTKATVAVLQAIIANGVSITSPYSPIFARKTTLAKSACVSEATVYRALNNLEDRGLIKRIQQERLDDGSLDIAKIVITEKLAILTGIIEINNDDKSADSDTNEQQSTNNETEETNVLTPNASTDTDNFSSKTPTLPEENLNEKSPKSDQMRDGLRDATICSEQISYQQTSVNNQSAPPKFVRIEGRSVARELLWLITDNRLTFGGLFQLQTMAKQVEGQTLSDFVRLRRERIRQLRTTNDCYRYIKSLIDQKIDARNMCSYRDKRDHAIHRQEQKKQATAKRDAFLRSLDGQTFHMPGDPRTYEVNARTRTLSVGSDGDSINLMMPITHQFLVMVKKGELVVHRRMRDDALNREYLDRISKMFRIGHRPPTMRGAAVSA